MKTGKRLLASSPTIFLRVALIGMALIAMALCIFVVPPVSRETAAFLERGNVLPFVMSAAYSAAFIFFIALYQASRLLTFIDRKQAFSHGSVRTLKNIKYCGGAIGFVFALLMPIVYLVAEKDDAPGLIIIGAACVGAALTVAVFAALLAQLIEDALVIKSENDLTV